MCTSQYFGLNPETYQLQWQIRKNSRTKGLCNRTYTSGRHDILPQFESPEPDRSVMSSCEYIHYRDIIIPHVAHDMESLEFAQNFPVEDTDVFAVTYPKSGTSWMQEILPLVLNGGDLTPIHTIPNWDRVPWLEEKRLAVVVDKMTSPRAMVSHFPYHLMPPSFHASKAKVIYVMRNPKDVLVSSYYFHQMASFLHDPGTFDEFMADFLEGKVLFGKWTDHVKGWKNAELGDRIMFITYEDMSQDLPAALRRMSDFLGRNLSAEVIQKIAEHCSFKAMKGNDMSNFKLVPKELMDSDKSPFLRKDAKMEIITSKQDVLVGEEILLLCKAGGDGDITWKKDDEEIYDEDKVSKVDETSSKLYIKNAAMEDAGRYICLCEFDSGHSDNTAKQLYVYEGPSFGQTSTYHEFLEGTDGAVPCVVTGQPAVEVHWIRDKQAIPANEGMRVRQLVDNTVIIEKVKREDAGIYLCRAQIRGRPIYQELSISVVVNAPPTVQLKQEEKTVLAGPQTHVTFLCLVDGLPKPSINWTMPMRFDPSHHLFNSDRSQLTIKSVARADYGEYICTAINKISESSATIMLHVFEAPEVFVSAEQQSVLLNERVSVSCNVSGHPHPQLHWLNKHNGQTLDSTSGRVHVADGALVIEEMMPSDGGLYSCMAVSPSGNASRDVAIYTQPGLPLYLSVLPGPTSVIFSLKTLPINGGTPVTSFVLQWRRCPAEQWEEITIPSSDPLSITGLEPYTMYTVRMAALNAVGVGQFSDTSAVRTRAKLSQSKHDELIFEHECVVTSSFLPLCLLMAGEPDRPILSVDKMKVEKNSFSVPLKLMNNGGSPLQQYKLKYRQDKEGTKWEETQLPSDANFISLEDLSFSLGYQLEVTAVNANGSSLPAMLNFTIGEQPVSSRKMTKGSVAAIVIVIFLLVFFVVDLTCCYRNHCGLLMYIAVKVFGKKIPGMKMLEEVEGTTNGELKAKEGSIQMAGVPAKEGGQLTEVTCDKVSLTKHEKMQPGRDVPNA
ncbi:neural cell adhesion molecule 1 [Antennarius striatus]|uniref:neural cell adhesion molecule 1 n=1 Tax=Antennarius striatus TaxID=241820 RepID=UPI0035AFC60C